RRAGALHVRTQPGAGALLSRRRILPGLRPTLPHAVPRAGQLEMRRRPAQCHGAPLVALGTGARDGAAGGGPGAWSRFRRAVSPPAAQRAHPARSFAVDGPALASRRAARPAAHAGAVRTRSGDHGDYAGREGTAGGHRALRSAAGAGGGGAGSGGPLVPSGGDRPGGALLPLRGDVRAAQESRHAAGSLARSARPSRGGPGARRAAARRRSRNPPRARTAPGGRSGGCRTARAVFGRAGVCLPVVLRRLRTAGAGSHAVRRARHRLARGGRSRGRCRHLRRYAARTCRGDGIAGVAPRPRGRGARTLPGAGKRVFLGTDRPPDPSGLRGGACPVWSVGSLAWRRHWCPMALIFPTTEHLHKLWGGPPGPRSTPPSASCAPPGTGTVVPNAGRGRPARTRGPAPPMPQQAGVPAPREPMTARPSALFLAPEAPCPIAGGGALRSASQLEYLGRHYDVDVIVFRQPGAPDPASLFPIGLARRVTVLELPPNRRGSAARALRNAGRVVRRIPPLVDRFAGFSAQVARALGGTRYHLGLIEHSWCAPYLEQVSAVCARTVLDLHNVESVLHGRCAEAEGRATATAHRVF